MWSRLMQQAVLPKGGTAWDSGWMTLALAIARQGDSDTEGGDHLREENAGLRRLLAEAIWAL